jgi:hypothetical protein
MAAMRLLGLEPKSQGLASGSNDQSENECCYPIMKLPRLRFTLGAVFFAVLCLAGLFAGYRIGYDRGYRLGYRERVTSFALILEKHPISDLMGSNGSRDALQLIDDITSEVRPDSWEGVGGPGNIRLMFDQDRPVLVVNQTIATQDEVAAFLTAKRVRGAAGSSSD